MHKESTGPQASSACLDILQLVPLWQAYKEESPREGGKTELETATAAEPMKIYQALSDSVIDLVLHKSHAVQLLMSSVLRQ